MKLADTMPDGWRVWLDWHKVIAPDNHAEIAAIEADAGAYLGYIRAVAERRPDLDLAEPMESVATTYVKQRLFRE